MDIVIRASVIFFILYLLVRIMGKRELGQMTPFELIVLVVIGDLVQQGVTHNDFSLLGALLAVVTMAFWALVLSWATYLSRRAESLLDGEPRGKMSFIQRSGGGGQPTQHEEDQGAA
jgi:uncharacterized membrane protein YcaP (DUF421 family)